MKTHKIKVFALALTGLVFSNRAFATNPLIMDQFTADPSAKVFDGKIYLYPSHDIVATPGKGRANWFCMEDYHAFSSENLMDWTDHGVLLSQTTVDWTDPNAYAMWAPDCVFKDGKYYFYFPATAKTGGFAVGVATADSPSGPFKPEAKPIEGVRGIDPCVFIDKDGQAYIYFSQGKIFAAKLKSNMKELDSPVKTMENLPASGLVEGPFMFERNGIYYLTFPHVQNKIERLEYMTGDNPLGPFKPAGVILDESESGCWTVHHSIVEYKGQWYLFYHDRDLSPDFDKNRSVRADYLTFNDDGTIKKVIPTLRGVGVADAKSKLQLDRYSAIHGDKTAVSFLNPANKFEGWKIALEGAESWVRFNNVDFGAQPLKTVNLRVAAGAGGTLEVRLDSMDGPVLARVDVPKNPDWSVVSARFAGAAAGKHDLFVSLNGSSKVELDWASFE